MTAICKMVERFEISVCFQISWLGNSAAGMTSSWGGGTWRLRLWQLLILLWHGEERAGNEREQWGIWS